MRRANLPLIIALAIVVAGIAIGVPLLHRYQVRRNAEGIVRQATERIEAGDDAGAIQLLTRYVSLRPDDTEQYARLARLLLSRAESGKTNVREIRAASNALEVAVRRNPDDLELRQKLATFLSALGDHEPALDHLSILRSKLADGAATPGAPRSPDGTEGVDKDAVDVLYATTSARARHTDEAEKALSALVGFDPAKRSFDPGFVVPPGRVEVFVFLANILESDRRDGKTADEAIGRMVEAYHDDPLAWRLAALWHLDHARVDEAQQAASRAMALDPGDTVAAMAALRAAVSLGEYDRAEEILAGPLHDAPATEMLFIARANLARAKGEFDAAIRILDEGLAAIPDNPALMKATLAMLADMPRPDELRKAIAELKPKLPKDVPALLLAEATVAMQEQRWLPAVQILGALRPLVATDAAITRRIDLALARCHAGLGQSDQASDARTRAFAAIPASAAARLAEMAAHEAAGRWDDAIAIAEDLTAALPDDRLAGAPELWRPLFRLRLIDQARRDPGGRDWTKVDDLIDRLARSPGMKPPLVERLRIDARTTRGDRDGALEASAAAVAANPDDPGLLAQRVILLAAAGRPEEGRAVLDAVAAPLRDSVDVLGAEIDLASASAPEEAAHWLSDVEARSAALAGPAADDLRRNLISVHVTRGSFSDAQRLAADFLAGHPDDLPVREMLLDVADEQDDATAVAAQATEIVRIAGSDDATGRMAQAVRRIVDVRARGRLGPSDAAARGLTAEDRGALESARALLAEAGAQRPRWSEVPRQQAAIAEIQGDRSAAIGLLRQAVELREAIPLARRRLALLLALSGRLDEARPVIESLGNAGGPAVDRLRAEWLAASGDTDAALAIGARLAPPACRDASLLVWHAALLARGGRAAEAEAVCRSATGIAPGSPDVWSMLVRVQIESGNRDRAEATRSEALATLEGPARERFEVLVDGLAIASGAGPDDGQGLEQTSRDAIAADPGDLVAARRLVELLVRRQRIPEATAELRRIIGLDSARDTPTVIWARRLLAGQLAASRGYRDFQEAMGLLAKNVDQGGRPLTEDMAMSVVLLLRREDPASWRQALSTLDALATRRKLTVDERVTQALLQAKLSPRLKTKARDELIGIAASADTSTAVVASVIEMLLEAGDPQTARTWVDKLRALAPDAPNTLRLEAKLALAQDDRDAAERIVRRLVPDGPLDGRSVPGMIMGAEMAEQLGFPEVADRVFSPLAARSPEGVLLRARSLARRHRSAEAIALLDSVRNRVAPMAFLDALALAVRLRSEEIDPDTQAKVESWLAAARRENPDATDVEVQVALINDLLGRSDEAARTYRELLAGDRLSRFQSGIVAGNLAWLLARPETADEAGELVDRAIRELGPHPDVLDTRALVRLAKGQTILALEDMEDAILAPTPIKYVHLAAVRVAANDLDGARAALEQSRKSGLAQQYLSAEEAGRVKQIEDAIAAGQGES